ncbi:MAG: hypothetical protein WD795_00645 [Woeseia sp.]
MKHMVTLLALLFTSTAHAQFADDFNRADELLNATSWTKATGGASALLAVDNNQVESDGVESARRLYTAPDQGSANMYAHADVAGFTGRGNPRVASIVVRAQGDQDYLWIGVSNTGVVECGQRVANSDTTYFTAGGATNPDALRIEAEGTNVRCYEDDGAGGWTLLETENSVSVFASETSAGLVTALGTDAVPLWDNYETGALNADDGSLLLLDY